MTPTRDWLRVCACMVRLWMCSRIVKCFVQNLLELLIVMALITAIQNQSTVDVGVGLFKDLILRLVY